MPLSGSTSARPAPPLMHRLARGAAAIFMAAFMPLAVCWAQVNTKPYEWTAASLQATLDVEFERLLADPARMDRVLQTGFRGALSPEHLQVARRGVGRTMRHANFTAWLTPRLLPLAQAGVNAETLLSASQQAMITLQVRGLSRLGTEQQAQFVTHMVRMMSALPADDCKGMFLGLMTEAEAIRLEQDYLASMTLPQFTDVFAMYGAAAQRELDGYPDVLQVTPEQARLTGVVWERAVAKRIADTVGRTRYDRYVANPSAAPAADVCDINNASLAAMNDLPDPYLRWKLATFVQSMN